MQGHFPLSSQEEKRDLATGATWAPSPKMNLTAGAMWVPAPKGNESPSSAQPDSMRMREAQIREPSFGFAGPDDRVVSLNIPASGDYGREHPFTSFDIEFDPEQPDRLAICLFETDEDNFIRTVQKSAPFPARLLAELLGRRQATPQEMAAWQSASDEDE